MTCCVWKYWVSSSVFSSLDNRKHRTFILQNINSINANIFNLWVKLETFLHRALLTLLHSTYFFLKNLSHLIANIFLNKSTKKSTLSKLTSWKEAMDLEEVIKFSHYFTKLLMITKCTFRWYNGYLSSPLNNTYLMCDKFQNQ